jgi:hypothetical protein
MPLVQAINQPSGVKPESSYDFLYNLLFNTSLPGLKEPRKLENGFFLL